MQRTTAQAAKTSQPKMGPGTIFLALGVGGAGLALAPRLVSSAAKHFSKGGSSGKGFATMGSMWKRSGGGASTGFKNFYKGGFESEMTRAEAALILGIRQSAPKEKIRLAHRRIMLLNHPDNGGSDYMASKINEAKDVLVKDLN